jgi:hypothetical protein
MTCRGRNALWLLSLLTLTAGISAMRPAIHLVLEVKDDAKPPLRSYGRAIVTVQ